MPASLLANSLLARLRRCQGARLPLQASSFQPAELTMQYDGAHYGAHDGADGRMTVQMMAQTTARGMRLLAKPVAGGAPPP